MSRVDPAGTSERVSSALPTPLAAPVLSVLGLSGREKPADAPDAPKPLVSASTSAPSEEPGGGAARQEPAQAREPEPEAVTVRATEVLTAQELEEEQARRAELEARLLDELERVRGERDALLAEGRRLQEELAQQADAAPAPRVVLQSVPLDSAVTALAADVKARATSDALLEELLGELAHGGAVGSHSASFARGSLSEGGLDLSREEVLAAGASVDAAQARLREILVELHCRARAEGVRLREALRHADDAATRAALQQLAAQLAAQERELQRAAEQQAREVQQAAFAEMARRDARFDSQVRERWGRVNARAERLGSHLLRLRKIRDQLDWEQRLGHARGALAAALDGTAEVRTARLEELRAAVAGLDEDVDAAAREARAAHRAHSLQAAPPPPPSLVLIGHVASLTPY